MKNQSVQAIKKLVLKEIGLAIATQKPEPLEAVVGVLVDGLAAAIVCAGGGNSEHISALIEAAVEDLYESTSDCAAFTSQRLKAEDHQ